MLSFGLAGVGSVWVTQFFELEKTGPYPSFPPCLWAKQTINDY